MRTFLRFLKPYQGLCLLTLLVMALDVAGALYLPTIVADMINIGVAGGDLDFILRKGGLMLGVALVSGGGTLVGCFLCARLSARIGRDMRNALYDKSLTFSASDFEGFGTGSMITRTLNDVNVVQQAFVWSVQMVLPVPLMCVIGVLMAFSIDHVMGLLLIGITLVVILGAVLVTRRASAIFARAQRFLDRISVVVRENITGARVIRAVNKAPGEAGRMRRSFTDYAQAAIQANTLFFVLESLAIFFLNLCVVAILWLGGNRIGGGFMEIGDITALTEYAVLILFYVMMAQMVLMLLPRAKVCLERIDAVLSHRPEITDGAGSLPQTEGEAVCAFQHAWFRFADADEATLQDLDFVLRRGQTTAIIGSTGSGKSTTLAALIDSINHTRAENIITMEDPIEYVYTPDQSVISQREIGQDTESYSNALRAVLREDPDVVLIGEMRDLDTIQTALTAAETGHFVLATLHTKSAADSIDRMVDVFPEGLQRQVRMQLSTTLVAVLSQQLLPRRDGTGRALACELMMVTPAIRNLIREGKTPQIAGSLATSASAGSVTMDNALIALARNRDITSQTAIDAAHDVDYVRKSVR